MSLTAVIEMDENHIALWVPASPVMLVCKRTEGPKRWEPLVAIHVDTGDFVQLPPCFELSLDSRMILEDF